MNRQNIKILFVATEPDAGMVTFASSIINSFYDAGFEVWALTMSQNRCPYNTALHIGERHISWPYPSRLKEKVMHKLYPINVYKKIKEIAKAKHIQNIHFLTGEYGFAPMLSLRLDKEFNLVYTVHDLEQHPSNKLYIVNQSIISILDAIKQKLFNRFFHWMTIRNLSKISNIVTCSRSQYEKIKQTYPNKSVVFHQFPSLMTEIIAKGTEVCPELEGEKEYILFFGYVGYRKGIDLLYNAFLDSNLVDDYKLVVAGRGSSIMPNRTDIRNIIRINRFIKDEEIASIYQNAAFVVYPYRQVTMSGVLTIARYFEKPCVTSDLPYFQDNMSVNDIMAKTGNKEDLKIKMEMMARNKKKYISIKDENDFVSQLCKIYK